VTELGEVRRVVTVEPVEEPVPPDREPAPVADEEECALPTTPAR
jgi:hypothetical protein